LQAILEHDQTTVGIQTRMPPTRRPNVDQRHSTREVGGPVTPILDIIAFVTPFPVLETELAYLGNDLFNATGHVQFGSTITLQQLTATDGNGALIPGLRLSSAEGYSYPTDPNNLAPGGAVPEPSTLTLLAPIAVLAVWRLFAGARSTRTVLSPRLPR
jgi:hypothetical protein